MPQLDYRQDRQWEGSYTQQIIAILTPLMQHLAVLDIASDEKDMKRATDFELQLKGGAIACRLRRPYYNERDLTIRSKRANGVKTELAKILEGLAPARYFYGWTDEQNKIAEWMLVDMDKVRTEGLLQNRKEKANRDGTTFFIWIPAKELFEADCLIDYQLIKKQKIYRLRQPAPQAIVSTFFHAQKKKRSRKEQQPMLIPTLFEGMAVQQQDLFNGGGNIEHEQ